MTDYSGSSTGAELDKAGDLVSTGTTSPTITTGAATSGTVEVTTDIGAHGTTDTGGAGVSDVFGLQLIGHGSSFDVSLLNQSGGQALGVVQGTNNLQASGNLVLTAGSLLVNASSPRAGYIADFQEPTDNGVNIQAGISTDIVLSLGSASVADKFLFTAGGDLTVASGDINLTAGDLVIGTSGKGIDFSATSDAGGMTSELLDDYEEGNFTAILSDGTNNATMVASVGKYQKVGNRVHWHCYFSWSNLASVSGAVRVIGMPYASSGASNDYASIYCGIATGLNVTAGESIAGYQERIAAHVLLHIWSATTGINALTTAELTGAGSMMLSGSYGI